jgi:filamentous hemagglutinin
MSTYKRVSGDYIIKSVNGGDSIVLDTDVTTITGDLTVVGNAVLTGNINADRIFNGTSNVEIAIPSGNVTVGVGGVNNVLDIGTVGVAVSGVAFVTGNVTGANINTSGRITATGNITAGNIDTAGNVLITGDSSVRQPTIRFSDTDTTVFPTQVVGAIEWFTNDLSGSGARVTSAIRSTYTSELGNAAVEIFTSTGGAAATSKFTVLSTGNVGVGNNTPLHLFSANGTAYFSSTVDAIGNVTGGNLLTAGSITATGDIVGGNINTAGLITSTGNITSGNIISLGAVSAGADGMLATGNIRGGNLLSDGVISATGNLTTTDIFATSLSASGDVLASGLSVSGNVIDSLSVDNQITSTSVDTVTLVTNKIRSDDSSFVTIEDGVRIEQGAEIVGDLSASSLSATTFLQLPVFASNGARDAGITSPQPGMMIFVTDGDGSSTPLSQIYANAGVGWQTVTVV